MLQTTTRQPKDKKIGKHARAYYRAELASFKKALTDPRAPTFSEHYRQLFVVSFTKQAERAFTYYHRTQVAMIYRDLVKFLDPNGTVDVEAYLENVGKPVDKALHAPANVDIVECAARLQTAIEAINALP